jgi:hypothetical protein
VKIHLEDIGGTLSGLAILQCDGYGSRNPRAAGFSSLTDKFCGVHYSYTVDKQCFLLTIWRAFATDSTLWLVVGFLA